MIGQPGRQLRKENNDGQPDELKEYKGYDTPVYMAGCDFRRV